MKRNPVTNNFPGILFLFLAILISAGIFYIFYHFYYTFVAKPEDPMMIRGKLPVIDDKLIKLVNWRNHMMVKFRIIKESFDKYILLVRFNANDIPQLFDIINQEELKKQIDERENRLQKISLFDIIVQTLDQSTASQKVLEPEVIKSKDINDVAEKTEALFGIEPEQPEPITSSIPTMGQSEINDLYRLLDMVEIDLELQEVISVEFKDRVLFLKIPLYRLQKTQEYTHLRFDPNQALKELGNTAVAQSIKTMKNIFELYFYTNQLVIFPLGQPTNRITIPLS